MSSSEAVPTVRLDRFLDGGFTLAQPSGSGFRAGLDALLLAATVPGDARGAAADLGAGTGAVGFAAASRAPGLSVAMVENDAAALEHLRASMSLDGNADLAPRLCVLDLDILSARPGREAAGLGDGRFDLVLTNPPFYPSGHRASPDPARRAALSATGPDFLTRWFRVSASLLRPGGRLAAIARPADLPVIADALANRLGGLAVMPVHTRAGAATRILVGAVQGSRRELSILPGLVLFDEDGPANAISSAIASGRHHIDLFDGRS